MENKANSTIKRCVTTQSSDNDIFLDTALLNIYKDKTEEKVEEINHLINLIRKHNPISLWDLCKIANISHGKLYYLIRDLEFAGVVYTKITLNKNNRSARMIYISKGVKK